MSPTPHIDREYAEHGIFRVEVPAERVRLLELAAQMLEWQQVPGVGVFPSLSRPWVDARGWDIGLKIWADAISFDEEAWCRAAVLASPATELVGVNPEPTLAKAEVFRVPRRPWCLNRFFSPNSLSVTLLFPEDLGFVVYKDDGETLVAAGPSEFVDAFFPEGTATAEAAYRADAADYTTEADRAVRYQIADRYGRRVPVQR